MQSGLEVCAVPTDNPWVLACYLQIASHALTAHGGATEPSAHARIRQGLEVCTDWVCGDIDLAAQKGCVLVVYECAGRLTLTGYALDEDMLLNQQALESSTFFNPARAEPWSELQARTRAAEDTHENLRALGGLSVRISDVFSLDQKALEEAIQAPPPVTEETEVTPAASCTPYAQGGSVCVCWTEPAGVGRLGKVLAYVPPELQRDRQVWLRSTVTPELFASLRDNKCRMWVERLWLANEEGEAFVVVVQSDAEMAVIALKRDDARFAQAYGGWAAAGVCPLAIENLRNGRMVALSLAWPENFTGRFDVGDESAAEYWLRLGQRALGGVLHQDWAVREVAERVAACEGRHLTCGFSDANDEFGWAVDSQLTW